MKNFLPLQLVHNKNDYRKLLFSKAFLIVHGTKYNEVSYEMREKNRGRSFHLYEIILRENRSWEDIRDEIYPPLIRYLRYKSVDPRVGEGVVIAAFFADHFYLIEYPEFIKVYREMEGVSEKGFHLRVKAWLAWGAS